MKHTTEKAPRHIFWPSDSFVSQSQMTDFIGFCEREIGRAFSGYVAFEDFCAREYSQFWRLFMRWSSIAYEGELDPVCTDSSCEAAEFFPGVSLNYAEVLLGANEQDDLLAVTACHLDGRRECLTRSELRSKVLRLSAFLIDAGVKPGDRVAVIARNNSDAIVIALATAKIGAVFASCSPNMGAFAILSRFTALQPSVLVGHVAAEPYDTGVSVADRFVEVAQKLPDLKSIVLLDDGEAPEALPLKPHRLTEVLRLYEGREDTTWQRFPFNHPLFILFSSGTTGPPKCIVHGAGGTLIEHLKEHRLHCDLRSGDKLFYNTTCAWMMWNWQLTALASNTELVVYDGPIEDASTLWRIVSDERVTVFGTSPSYLKLGEKLGHVPKNEYALKSLRSILSTGSILYPGQYDWVAQNVKNVPLQSISGGTDIIGCFVLGNPNLPVYRGEAQCRSLGLDVRSLPPQEAEESSIGELICANPFPSRPLEFFGDSSGEKFHRAYFSQNPGMWTHGDLIEITGSGGARMHGRSDGVLNINGIRIGPAEIYHILEGLEELDEALVVEQLAENEAGGSRMVLVVVPAAGFELDSALVKKIRAAITRNASAALLPACIADVKALPKTHSGKISEAAVRDALNGRTVRNRDALQNPDCLEEIANHSAIRPSSAPGPATLRKSAKPKSLDELRINLQQIFKDFLGLDSISGSDNLHEIGMDSLQIVSITVEIEHQLGCKLPFEAFYNAQNLDDLANFLAQDLVTSPDRGGTQPPLNKAQSANSGAQQLVRPAKRSDIETIIQLLQAGFSDSRVAGNDWCKIFDYPWLSDKPNFGFVAVDGDLIVGFIGVIYANRSIRGKQAMTANLTSWYVRPEYRWLSVALAAKAVENDSITYTALTPAPVTSKVLKTLGFSERNAPRLLLPPLVNSGSLFSPALAITFDTDSIASILRDEHRSILRDHSLPDCLHVVLGSAPDYCYLVIKRRLRTGKLNKWLPLPLNFFYSEILYCSDWDILLQNLERVKLKVMRRQGTLAMALETHNFKATSKVRGVRFTQRGFYKSLECQEKDIDKLYSEVVLLPL
jgi:acetoacetyl-CoA synthetase